MSFNVITPGTDSVNETGTDPLVPGYTGIKVDLDDNDTVTDVGGSEIAHNIWVT